MSEEAQDTIIDIADKAEGEEVVKPAELTSPLVGEGKKYATVDVALASLPAKEEHIAKLEAELAEARAREAEQESVKSLIEDLRTNQTREETTPEVGVKPDQIKALVQNAVAEEKQKDTLAANIHKAATAFKAKFGDNAKQVYEDLAKGANVSVAELNEIAKVSPEIVLQLAGIKGVSRPTVKNVETLNAESVDRQIGNNTSPESSYVKDIGNTQEVLDAWAAAGRKARADHGIT